MKKDGISTMKVLHLNAGNDTGGGMTHILDLLENSDPSVFTLGIFEPGPIYQKALQRGIRVKLFATKKRYDLSVIQRLKKYIESEQMTMIHTHGARANLYGYLLKKTSRECKWVTTLHSNPYDDFLNRGLKGKAFTKLHLWLLKHPDYYFAISKRSKELLLSHGVDGSKVKTIFNGIDFNRQMQSCTLERKGLGLEANDFVIAMVARLTPVKGHRIALEAISRVMAKAPQVKLLLIGDGFLEQELKAFVNNKGLAKQIKFLGYRQDIDALLQISDLHLLSSLSENFPIVLLEAARAKKPVISTDVGGVCELIPSKDYGWLVPVKDVDALALAIEEAINAHYVGSLKKIGENLYKHASRWFSVEHFRENVMDAYKNWT